MAGVFRKHIRRRFTNLFEALTINVLLAANVKKAAELLRLTWDEALHLMERAVLRGRAAKHADVPRQIGVDKKAIEVSSSPSASKHPWFMATAGGAIGSLTTTAGVLSSAIVMPIRGSGSRAL